VSESVRVIEKLLHCSSSLVYFIVTSLRYSAFEVGGSLRGVGAVEHDGAFVNWLDGGNAGGGLEEGCSVESGCNGVEIGWSRVEIVGSCDVEVLVEV
jgi:hypothetical protein